jgi:hypothetical protein
VLRDGDAFFATRDESGFTVTRLTPVRFVGCRGRARPWHHWLAGSTTRRCVSFRRARRR